MNRLPAGASPRDTSGHSPGLIQWWDYAHQTARALWAGDPLPPFNVYGPVLEAQEMAYLSAEATYSRFAPGDDRYNALNVVVFARPAITASTLAIQGLVNHRRKAAARRAAAPTWRGSRDVHVVLTSERLLANTAAGWISFWHDAVTEFYVDLYRWTMALGFGDQCPPVKFTGLCVPAISVMTAHRIYGDQWSADPRLAVLLT